MNLVPLTQKKNQECQVTSTAEPVPVDAPTQHIIYTCTLFPGTTVQQPLYYFVRLPTLWLDMLAVA